MNRLREMSRKYPVKVLNYLVGTHGYRLLLAAPDPATLSSPIANLNGTIPLDLGANTGKQS